MPKLLVFGGGGYVGSHVCQEALNTGLQIVSINRSGRPKGSEPWKDEVEWVSVRIFAFCFHLCHNSLEWVDISQIRGCRIPAK